ncbi:MAG: nucleoside 2-deoxyribosyltransferase [Phycisphaerales bacterium]|nr:nucleoside 2-deoxyribosyltransferase [Phycisphaerales bacterium]
MSKAERAVERSCFVIQPFDHGKFDRRYGDVFKPAIVGAGFRPDRVDEDHGADIPIERIEQGIRNADLCFADISTDNANVWFEVGFAIACGRPLCLVCSDEREGAFPFDVRHRRIIKYATGSSSDFSAAQSAITERLKAIGASISQQTRSPAEVAPIGHRRGMPDHELAALAAISIYALENIESMSGFRIAEAMQESGFTKLAATLAVQALQAEKLIVAVRESSQYSQGEEWIGFKPTPKGAEWLLSNQSGLQLRTTQRQFTPIDEKDIPF